MKSSVRSQLVPVIVVEQSQPTKDNQYYWFGQQIKQAFGNLFEHFYGDIQITPDKHGSQQVEITLNNKAVMSCFGASGDFEFLATSQFTYRPDDNEPWDLEIKALRDGFGIDMSVRGKTAKDCVRGMISERKKFLKRQLSDLCRRSRSFENYTRMRHTYG